ncbi:SGNH/GDSL hydrolase family protein [Streptomyces sp. NPDC051567]|uniref:SGNH/GDSL hydrolase family protein n=1 Tax=Streptomyces sp. NPDC051567 TaxID=3365660 RepID=UPI00379C52AA
MRHPVSRLRARALAVGVSALAAATLLPSTAVGAADPYEWAALGDSYTAGLFVGTPRPALGDASRDGCDRTAGSYPDLVGKALAARPLDRSVRLTDVSCGNAAISHVALDQQQPISPVQPPEGDPYSWPMVEPQTRRAGLGQRTDVVTVGIGGNSLPFGGMLFKCLELGFSGTSCKDYYTNPPEGEEGIDEKLARVRDEYNRMLGDVHSAAPYAKVVTVGYPAVLPEQGGACNGSDLTQIGPISSADIDWLRVHVLKALNGIIEQSAASYGDSYVDIYTSSVGHDVCKPEGVKWIEGICGDAENFWPTVLPGALPLDCAALGKRATLVHPNAKEHANAAPHVERAVREALQG